jgi:hypothetical protein
MMAPHYEQARMLHVAIDRAIAELGEPIDRLEVTAGKVRCWAGTTLLTMRYSYQNSYNERGAPMLGGGEWVVEVVAPNEAAAPAEPSFIARLLARLLRP